MKLNTVNNEYQLKSQNIQRYQASEEYNNFSKNKSIYPQDKIDLSTVAKQSIQSIDSKQIELTYSLPLKKVSAEIINKDGVRIEIKNENLPKELRGINSPEVFSRFFKNTYAKVSILSDGNYKLDINHKLLGGGYESGSITPTTQGKARFDFSDFSTYINKQEGRLASSKDIFSNIKTLEKEEETFEKMLLSNDIILKSRRVLKELQHITVDDFIFQLDYKENINQMQSEESPLVKRFGINPNSVKDAAGYGIAGSDLHYVEQKAFEVALQELSTTISAEEALQNQMIKASGYPNNIVLVDIFAREEGKIKIDSKADNCPETHTIVLWKKTNNTIILIDPSMQGFSIFLKNSLSDQFDIQLELPNLASKDGVLYGINYTGYSSNKIKKRDCIDIAVKIGCELNELQRELTDVNIIQNTAIKHITNDLKINDSLDSVKKLTLPFENIQSTNKDIRKSSSKLISDYANLKTEIATQKLSKLDPIIGVFEKEIKSFDGLKRLIDSVNLLKEI
jgi:hypothetical protein